MGLRAAMTEMKIDFPEELAAVVEKRAEEVGIPSDQWLSLMVTDMVADLPDEGDGSDDWIGR
jgi:hypothetical protein